MVPHQKSSLLPSASRQQTFAPQTSYQRNTIPFAASPLRGTMSASTNHSDSAHPLQETPTRASRSVKHQTRPRGESRSSSVPASLHVPRQPSDATSTRSISPGLQENRRSVKHLTCFWWKEKGTCRYNEEDCLYAHYDTGRYTDPPRQVIPGEPAKAGRSLDRALRNLALVSHDSSTSISNHAGSGASTPGLELPLTRTSFPNTDPANLDQSIDNAWLRSMLNQANHEKSLLFTTVENLQTDKTASHAEKASLQASVDNLKAENEQLTQERDLLRGVVNQLQHQRTISNPYGVIGASRNTGSRGSWHGPAPTSRASSAQSEPEQQNNCTSIIRNLGPNF